ncbi:pyridoxamine 5'-phosphate oxidase family protein [Teredinibacter turnerae]|uniref:pyridoxamine 5'-phosphate oxidase family protein n=1 Tax=Teredinibacter turnerae TaxID=2426 RepID=UPI00036E4047|nr:pyridoxamine 5'-phosphate oxidase family protein [Teredinibacter turnerae]
MPHKYSEIVFTETVKRLQSKYGSREGYAGMANGPDYNDVLGPREAAFISARNSCYMASVTETGWPYVQHKGGADGFMRVLDERTLGFVDFSGNRQYVTAGNVINNNRLSLFFMDYPHRMRLKLLGVISLLDDEDSRARTLYELDGYRAAVERAYVIHVEGVDWNCPQHITPRYSEHELEPVVNALLAKRLQDALNSQQYPQELGTGTLPLVVTGMRQLKGGMRAYMFSQIDGLALPDISPGAQLRVPVQLPHGSLVVQNYKIATVGENNEYYEVNIRELASDSGCTQAIFSHFSLGLRVNCDFVV